MDFQGSDIKTMKLLNAWDSIIFAARGQGCSAEQLRGIALVASRRRRRRDIFSGIESDAKELELEDVAMWLGQTPSRPLN